MPITLIGVVAFCLLGPYAYLGGAMALDFGGKAAGAVASGIIDGVGYLGAVFAGIGGAKLAATVGWRGVFATLARHRHGRSDRRRSAIRRWSGARSRHARLPTAVSS